MYTVPRSFGRIDAPESDEQSLDNGLPKLAVGALFAIEFRFVANHPMPATDGDSVSRRKP